MDEQPEKPEQIFGLSDDAIRQIQEALHSDYEDALVGHLADLTAADAAELLAKLPADDRRKLLEEHSAALDPATFIELPDSLRRSAIEAMPASQVAILISALDSDDALNLIADLDADFQKDVIRKLSSRTRISLETGLSFPEDSAGRLMQREFVAIPQPWTVGKTIDYLRAAAAELPEEFFDLFVITPAYRVAGHVPLSRLVRAKRSEHLEALLIEDTQAIPVTMDQEEVARIFRRENLTSAPVVDDAERLIGVITIDDIVDVIDKEAEEDALHLAGLREDDLHKPLMVTTVSRFWWLFVNLGTALLDSVVIGFFDDSIEKIVALAVLMPIVASMGGNAGTQSQTVAVRGLATRELSRANFLRFLVKETMVGVINGGVFAVLMGVMTGLWFHSPMLGVVIGMSMIINLICAGFAGVLIPLGLRKLGSDPAVSSTVFLTTVTDVMGFFSFLGLATIFLIKHRH